MAPLKKYEKSSSYPSIRKNSTLFKMQKLDLNESDLSGENRWERIRL